MLTKKTTEYHEPTLFMAVPGEATWITHLVKRLG